MINVNVKVLRAALKAVNAVVEKRTTVPICATVLVRSTPGQMFLTGTDLEIMVEKTVDLEDAGANSAMNFCVDASTLASIAGKLQAEGVAKIEADGNTGITIKCGRARFKLPTLPTDDFPVLAARDWDAEWEQDGTQLVQMIESVRFAISTEETRYYLGGIYVHVPSGSECQFAAATDGHRLARFHCNVAEGAEEMPGIIIPRKAIGALAQLLDEEGGTVGVSVSTTTGNAIATIDNAAPIRTTSDPFNEATAKAAQATAASTENAAQLMAQGFPAIVQKLQEIQQAIAAGGFVGLSRNYV